MPIDTAVTAMINEAASAAVAMSSILKVRRLDTVLPVMEDAKPTGPVSSAMIANPSRLSCVVPGSPRMPAPVRPDLGEAIDK
jgi:hypothetical protein